MAAVTIHSDFTAQEEEICHYFHLSPLCLYEVMGPDDIILCLIFFLIFNFKVILSLSFTLIRRLFSSSSLSAIRLVSSTYLRLLMFLPPILISACLLSQWCYLAISSSVAPFSFCLQSFPAQRSFQVSLFFSSHSRTSRSQTSASTSVLPWLISFRIDWRRGTKKPPCSL